MIDVHPQVVEEAKRKLEEAKQKLEAGKQQAQKAKEVSLFLSLFVFCFLLMMSTCRRTRSCSNS